MLGKYYIDIGNKYKKFHIEIEHRINVIKGNILKCKVVSADRK